MYLHPRIESILEELNMKVVWVLLWCLSFALQRATANCGLGQYCVSMPSGSVSICTCGFCQAGTAKSTSCLSGVNVMTSCSMTRCLQCDTGTFTPLGTAGRSSCTRCDAGKYSDVPGATSVNGCLNCPAGKFSSAVGAAVCTDCDLGKYSAQGSTECNDCMSMYNTYPHYQVMPVLADTCFRTCDTTRCLMSASNQKLVCAVGKGLTAISLSTSPAGRTWTMVCRECQSGYARMILKDYNSQINFFCVLCTNGVHSATPNDPAFVVPVCVYYCRT
jgi:hypothetical protein